MKTINQQQNQLLNNQQAALDHLSDVQKKSKGAIYYQNRQGGNLPQNGEIEKILQIGVLFLGKVDKTS